MSNQDNRSVGRRLSYFLEVRGLSQSDFARALEDHGGAGDKVGRQRVSNWITGRAEPSLSTVATICDVLGIDLGYFWAAKLPDEDAA